MWPDRVPNPGPLTYESGALPTALRGLAQRCLKMLKISANKGLRRSHHKRECCVIIIQQHPPPPPPQTPTQTPPLYLKTFWHTQIYKVLNLIYYPHHLIN